MCDSLGHFVIPFALFIDGARPTIWYTLISRRRLTLWRGSGISRITRWSNCGNEWARWIARYSSSIWVTLIGSNTWNEWHMVFAHLSTKHRGTLQRKDWLNMNSDPQVFVETQLVCVTGTRFLYIIYIIKSSQFATHLYFSLVKWYFIKIYVVLIIYKDIYYKWHIKNQIVIK